MRIVIVEDEAVVARRLERMVRNLVGSAEIDVLPSLASALERLRHPLDLLFLDLNLSGRDGFQLLEEAAASRFQTIVVSAHHEQALRAFEYGVTDFVPKPWTEERLRQAVDRARGRDVAVRGRARVLVIRKGRDLRSIAVDQIASIRGADDYSELCLLDGSTHLHEKTLAAHEALLPCSFLRVHRSHIANFAHVRSLRSEPGGRAVLFFVNGSSVPVGRLYREAARERLGLMT